MPPFCFDTKKNNIMKKKLAFLLCIVFAWNFVCAEDRRVIDEIRAIVYHDSGSNPILTSDLKPELDGTPCTLGDALCNELMLLDAQRLNINVSPDDADKYLDSLQKANHMSRAAMEQVMLDMGYTYEEGKEKLRRKQMIEQVIDFRVKSDKRFIVQREDVEAYDNEHPVFEEASFVLSQVVIPDVTDAEQELSGAELDQQPWEEPFEIKESELAESMRFIINEPAGTIVDRDLVGEGLELTKLVAKKLARRVPVDERYDWIMNQIRMKRFEQLMKDYRKELLENASIRFTHPEDKILVMESE